MAENGFKKVALIIAKEKFRDEELFETQKALEAADIRVTIVSSQMGLRKGMLGGEAEATLLVKDLNVDEFDGVVFIGGSGATEYFDELKAQAIAKDAERKGKLVGAICIAPRILANAGLLAGKKFTCFESEVDNVARLGGEFVDSDVQRDERIVTGRRPEAAPEFGQKLVEMLKEW